jgi:hypothetical protein
MKTMTEQQIDAILDDFTSRVVASIGFRRNGGEAYERPIGDAIAILTFPRRLSAAGTGLFTARIALRFEPLAKWLNDDPKSRQPTLGNAIHLLREHKHYTEWEFSDAEGLENLHDQVLADLESYALPFSERYSNMAELRKTLESSDKKDWIQLGLNVDTRVTVLAAIRIVEGDKHGAVKLLDDGITAVRDSLGAKPPELRRRLFHRRGFEMEYLRRRITSSR